ncbi:hypothetical protein BU16DRAFT_532582 [Lophium mytilinum]|uniref:Uncharacterized protein n=1 Tax=Lophium mytilinum TaxID=390894 RepID=A0A6A6RFF9_9PEZI|nr:hypothetical protein BU16DRAFT_532582 [Lophium mytilinum]
MSENLSVLVKTNDPSFIDKLDKDKIPILATQATDIAARNDIGMMMILYNFDNDLSATEAPAFVFPSSALPAFIADLWMPKLYIWTMQAALSISLPPHPSLPQASLEHHLLSPLTTALLAPTFFGVEPSASISPTHAATLQQRYVGSYAAGDHLKKLQSLQFGAVDKVQTGAFPAAADRYLMAIRFAHVVWHCHLQSIRATEQMLVSVLWLLTLDIYSDRSQVLLNIANAAAGEGASVFEQARENAEDGIAYLNAHKPFEDTIILDEEERDGVRKRKAKLSFRAAMACQGAGDDAAALGHLEQAMRLEPESRGTVRGFLLSSHHVLAHFHCRPIRESLGRAREVWKAEREPAKLHSRLTEA